MARDSIKPSKSPDGSVTYRVEDPPEGHIAAVTVGKNRDGSYWAVIEFRRGVGPGAMRLDCPHWPQPILTGSAWNTIARFLTLKSRRPRIGRLYRCNQFDSAISRCHSDRNQASVT